MLYVVGQSSQQLGKEGKRAGRMGVSRWHLALVCRGPCWWPQWLPASAHLARPAQMGTVHVLSHFHVTPHP